MATPEAVKKKLWEKALAVSESGYAPYSSYRVGACILTEAGKMYTGCNVENVAYQSVCAERSAISEGIAAEGEALRIKAIAVVAHDGEHCTPCGACRQAIMEHGNGVEVLFLGSKGKMTLMIQELLPEAFLPPKLRK